MQVNPDNVLRILSRTSKSPPVRKLKDILNDKNIIKDAKFRLSINDFKTMCKNRILLRMMTEPLNTTEQDLVKFCLIPMSVGEYIDLSAKTINEKINAMNAPLYITIRDLPDDSKGLIVALYTSMISTIFTSLKTFLDSLSNEVEKGHTLIRKIVASFSKNEKKVIVNTIRRFFNFKENEINPNIQEVYFDGFFPQTNKFDKIIKTHIRTIYSKNLHKKSTKMRLEIDYVAIELFSNKNNITFFKSTTLPSNIKRHLFSFMSEYTPKLDDRLVRYISNLIDDVIDNEYVYKFPKEDRDKVRTDDTLYMNYYYLLIESIEKKDIMVQKGMAVGTDEPTPSRKFVVEKENTDNDFTHEECKAWAMMPVFNPRTITPILIDSPLYNRLLCKSFHYDRSLIPRMITSRGYPVIYDVLFTEDYYDFYDKYASDNSSDNS